MYTKIAFILLFLSPLALAQSYTCSSTIQTIVSTNEGSRKCVYLDSLGHPTVGIGFNLDRSGASQVLANLGINYSAVRSGSTCLTDSQITQLFNLDLADAIKGAKECVSSYDSLPNCAQKVLVDMTFNMGRSSLCSWPNFIKQLASKDYIGAANNMKTSKWCGQVKSRCTRNVALIQSLA